MTYEHPYKAACPCGGARAAGDGALKRMAQSCVLQCGSCKRRLLWDSKEKQLVWRREKEEVLN